VTAKEAPSKITIVLPPHEVRVQQGQADVLGAVTMRATRYAALPGVEGRGNGHHHQQLRAEARASWAGSVNQASSQIIRADADAFGT
jgi:hypothetical protein